MNYFSKRSPKSLLRPKEEDKSLATSLNNSNYKQYVCEMCNEAFVPNTENNLDETHCSSVCKAFYEKISAKHLTLDSEGGVIKLVESQGGRSTKSLEKEAKLPGALKVTVPNPVEKEANKEKIKSEELLVETDDSIIIDFNELERLSNLFFSSAKESEVDVTQVSYFLINKVYPFIIDRYIMDINNTQLLSNVVGKLLNVIQKLISKPSHFVSALGLLISINGLLIIINMHLRQKTFTKFATNEWNNGLKLKFAQTFVNEIDAVTKTALRSIKLQQSNMVALGLFHLFSSRVSVSLHGLTNPTLTYQATSSCLQIGFGVINSIITQSIDKELISGAINVFNVAVDEARRRQAVKIVNKLTLMSQSTEIIKIILAKNENVPDLVGQIKGCISNIYSLFRVKKNEKEGTQEGLSQFHWNNLEGWETNASFCQFLTDIFIVLSSSDDHPQHKDLLELAKKLVVGFGYEDQSFPCLKDLVSFRDQLSMEKSTENKSTQLCKWVWKRFDVAKGNLTFDAWISDGIELISSNCEVKLVFLFSSVLEKKEVDYQNKIDECFNSRDFKKINKALDSTLNEMERDIDFAIAEASNLGEGIDKLVSPFISVSNIINKISNMEKGVSCACVPNEISKMLKYCNNLDKIEVLDDDKLNSLATSCAIVLKKNESVLKVLDGFLSSNFQFIADLNDALTSKIIIQVLSTIEEENLSIQCLLDKKVYFNGSVISLDVIQKGLERFETNIINKIEEASSSEHLEEKVKIILLESKLEIGEGKQFAYLDLLNFLKEDIVSKILKPFLEKFIFSIQEKANSLVKHRFIDIIASNPPVKDIAEAISEICQSFSRVSLYFNSILEELSREKEKSKVLLTLLVEFSTKVKDFRKIHLSEKAFDTETKNLKNKITKCLDVFVLSSNSIKKEMEDLLNVVNKLLNDRAQLNIQNTISDASIQSAFACMIDLSITKQDLISITYKLENAAFQKLSNSLAKLTIPSNSFTEEYDIGNVFSSVKGLLLDSAQQYQGKKDSFRVREIAILSIKRVMLYSKDALLVEEIRGILINRQAFERNIVVRKCFSLDENLLTSLNTNLSFIDFNRFNYSKKSSKISSVLDGLALGDRKKDEIMNMFKESDIDDSIIKVLSVEKLEAVSGLSTGKAIKFKKLLDENNSEKEAWADQEKEVKEKIAEKIKSLENYRLSAEQEINPLKKLEMVLCCKLEQLKLKQIVANTGDIGMKIGVVVEFLVDMSNQLSFIDDKLNSMQVDVKALRDEMKKLIGLPFNDLYDEWKNKYNEETNSRLQEKPYVEAEVTSGLKQDGVNLGFVVGWDDKDKNKENFTLVSSAFKSFMKSKANIHLLTGMAGSGKSTAVEKLKSYIVNEYAREREKEKGVQVILIQISLPTLKDPLGSLIEESINSSLGVKLNPLQFQEFVSLIKEGKNELVLFCDALDELKEEFLWKNLWRTNNLEQFRNIKDKGSINQPKVLITSRSELFAGKDKMETITSRNGDNRSITRPEYLKYFLPLDRNNIEKDEDIEGYEYVEEFRFVPFYDQKDKYQSQYVALLWRESFSSRFKNVFENDKYLIKPRRLFDEKEIFFIISECLNKMIINSKDRGLDIKKNITRQLVDIYMVCTLAYKESNEELKKECETKWIEFFDNWMTKGSNLRRNTLVKISDLSELLKEKKDFVEPKIERLFMIESITILLSLVSGIAGDVSREDLQRFINENEYNESLWLFNNYTQEFEALPELKELSNTPFMLEVVTNILPILKDNQTSTSQIKGSFTVQYGEKIGEIAWFKCQEIISNLKLFQQGLDNTVEKFKYMKQIAEVSKGIKEEIAKQFNNSLPEDIPKAFNKTRNNKINPSVEKKEEYSIFLNKIEHTLVLLLSRKKTRRLMIYDMFITQYINREVGKSLITNKGSMSTEALRLEGRDFSRHLALYMIRDELTKLVLRNHSILFHKMQEIDLYFSDSSISSSARKAAPVKIVNGNVLTFIHKTIQEFHVAEAIFEGVSNAVQDSLKTSNELEKIIMTLKLKNEEAGEKAMEFSKMFNAEVEDDSIKVLLKKIEKNVSEILKQNNVSQPGISKDKVLALESSDSREIRRLKSIIESLITSFESSPLNQFELANESAVIDFILDRILESDEVVSNFKMLHILLTEGGFLVKNRLSILNDNLLSICTRKIPRRQGKTLLHEAVIEGNERVVEWALDVSLSSTEVDLVNLRSDNGNTPIFLAIQHDNNDIFTFLFWRFGDLASCQSVSAKSDFNKLSEASFSEAKITNFVEYLCNDDFIKNVVTFTIRMKEFQERKIEYWSSRESDALAAKKVLTSKASVVIKALDSWMVDLESFLKNKSCSENILDEKIQLQDIKVSFNELKNLFQLDTKLQTCKDEQLRTFMNEKMEILIKNTSRILPSELLKLSPYKVENADLSQYSIPYVEVKSLIRIYIHSIKGFKIEKFNMTYEELFNQTKYHGINLIKEQMEKAMDVNEGSDGKFKSIAGSFLRHGTIIGRLRQSIYEKFPESLEADRMDKKINDESHTALTYSCAYIGSKEQAICFLENGSDINAQDAVGKTSLMWSLERGYLDVASMLIEKGVNFKLKDILLESTCLHYAARKGHLEAVKFLIEKNCYVYAFDKHKNTCLHYALENGHLEVVKFLIENYFDVHAKDSNYMHFAISKGNLEVVKYLVEKNCDIYAKDRNGDIFLHNAAARGHLEVVNFLIEKNCNVHAKGFDGYTCLHLAAGGGHLKMVKYLIEMKCDIHAKSKYNNTCLHQAAKGGHLEVAKLFLEMNCDVQVKGEYGNTCLHLAAKEGYLEIVKLFIENNCNVHAKDDEGRTCLRLALNNFHFEIVQYLLEVRDFDLLEKNEDGNSYLDYAVFSGEADIVALLKSKIKPEELEREERRIKYEMLKSKSLNLVAAAKDGKLDVVLDLLEEEGIDLNAQDWKSALMWSSSNGNLEIASKLIEKGCDINLQSYNGYTSLHYAVYDGQLEIVKLLIKKNCYVHVKEDQGCTCLSLALKYNRFEIVKYLLEMKSFDVLSKDNDGKNCLDYALEKENEGIINLLKSKLKPEEREREDRRLKNLALIAAVKSGKIDTALDLINEEGLDFDTKDKADKTALTWSIEKGYWKIASSIVEKGCDLKLIDKDGCTFLHLAVEKNQLELVKLLIEKKCDAYLKNKNDLTCFTEALRKRHFEIVKFLFESNEFDIFTKDKFRKSYLDYAIEQGNEDIVNLLLSKLTPQDRESQIRKRKSLALINAVMNNKINTAMSIIKEEGFDLDVKNESGTTAVMMAALRSHLEIASILVAKGSDLKIRNNFGSTCLHYAAQEGNLEMVKFLIEKNCDVHVKDNNGRSCLALALWNKRFDVSKYLLEGWDFDLLFKDEDGMRCLDYAINSENEVIVAILKSKLAHQEERRIKTEALFTAVMEGNLESALVLMDVGDINLNSKNNNGFTPLMISSAKGYFEIAQRLLEKGSDVNLKDNKGNTCLHFASESGNLEVANLLIENNCDVDAKNSDGSTSLHLASLFGHFEVTKLLIENAFELNAKDNGDHTCLHWAAIEGRLEVTNLLIENNCDINAKEKYGHTCLHLAAREGHLEVTKLLIEKSCDINAKDSDGSTCLHLASSEGHLEVVKLLIENNCDVHSKDKGNRTCLSIALKNEKFEIVVYLLEVRDFDLFARDKDGKSCLDYGMEKKKTDIIDLLKSKLKNSLKV